MTKKQQLVAAVRAYVDGCEVGDSTSMHLLHMQMCGALKDAEEESAEEETELQRANDAIETAWGVIANVSGGDWEKQVPTWKSAAERWRDQWHKHLDATRMARENGSAGA